MAVKMDGQAAMKRPERMHSVILENRQKMSISGVQEVDSFDEQRIVLYTVQGLMTIEGADLHISLLNVESGDIAIEGNIYGVEYSDDDVKRLNFWQRLMR